MHFFGICFPLQRQYSVGSRQGILAPLGSFSLIQGVLEMSTTKRHTRWAGRLFGRRSRSPSWCQARLRLEPVEDRLVPAAAAVLDPSLGLRTVVSGLITPTAMVFLGDNDFLALEKATGKV